MAKSVLDAGWSMFRNKLRYKASRHKRDLHRGRRTMDFPNVLVLRGNPRQQSERYGRAWSKTLGMFDCGATHDRDVNAALNILRVGRERPPPAVEIPAL